MEIGSPMYFVVLAVLLIAAIGAFMFFKNKS